MNLSDLANISQIIAAAGVVISLVYLAVQVRGNTKVVSAQTRHAISEFVLRISMFQAEHADRYARLASGSSLSEGDRHFRYWSHVQFLLHAETYFHHYELGLMPDEHWRGYETFMTRYAQSPGFKETWNDIGPGFSAGFARWINHLLGTPDLTKASQSEATTSSPR